MVDPTTKKPNPRHHPLNPKPLLNVLLPTKHLHNKPLPKINLTLLPKIIPTYKSPLRSLFSKLPKHDRYINV